MAQSLQLTLSARSASRPTLNADVAVSHPRTRYRLLVGLYLVDISTVIQKLTIALHYIKASGALAGYLPAAFAARAKHK